MKKAHSSEWVFPGGVNAAFRNLRTFLYWWEQEVEPEGWLNPIRKAKPPKVPLEILEPVSLEDIRTTIDICEKTLNGLRDKAILLGLLDTGARSDEFLGMKLDELNLVTGVIIIRQGKGGKFGQRFSGKHHTSLYEHFSNSIMIYQMLYGYLKTVNSFHIGDCEKSFVGGH